jgi:hypothetical protein
MQLRNSTVLDLRVTVIKLSTAIQKTLTFWYLHHLNTDPIFVLTEKENYLNPGFTNQVQLTTAKE